MSIGSASALSVLIRECVVTIDTKEIVSFSLPLLHYYWFSALAEQPKRDTIATIDDLVLEIIREIDPNKLGRCGSWEYKVYSAAYKICSHVLSPMISQGSDVAAAFAVMSGRWGIVVLRKGEHQQQYIDQFLEVRITCGVLLCVFAWVLYCGVV